MSSVDEHATTRTLRPSRMKTLGLLLLATLFTAGGVAMILAGQWIGWVVVAFFGLGMIVFAAMLLPNSSYLRIDPEGFTFCSLYRTHWFRWSDVGPFVVGRVSGNQMVMFDLSEEYVHYRRLREVSKALAGYHGALPSSYGLTHEELAELLNEPTQG